MKSFRMLMYVALLCSGLLVFGPSTARATPILDSDTLTVTFDGAKQTKTIVEGGGESVTDKIEFTFNLNDSDKKLFSNSDQEKFVYLVEQGATPNSNGLYWGFRSDKITLHVDDEKCKDDCKDCKDTATITITLNSDQDRGTDDKKVKGYLETGSLQDITNSIFSAKDLDILKDLGHTVDVRVASDVEPTTKVPEPTTLILLGLGLLGVVAVGRMMRSEER